MPVSKHLATWHKPTVTNSQNYNIKSDFEKCRACGGIGYAHQQKFFIENGKTVSEIKKEMDCLKCKGTGYILRNG